MPKKIIRLSQSEEAEFYCDITNEFLDFAPPVELIVKFGYGSSWDGNEYNYVFNDGNGKAILKMINKYIMNKRRLVNGEKVKPISEQDNEGMFV